ncbi:RNA polymerase sigma-70 factor, ECF subfamily [Marinactinospora thermotolerans DSM 45154]|uniref:RNA polymerase sigma-70 factor, ECF subfamily n=1 Tax=Marinactinospora thermotolerans DSM 45154 TaxID=1122192 RepID=A0A1T4PKP8_9ACTN|nr:sigma-70 family RNA polymerase sigma factor [Marinactinospora thermotolerans]SJZ91931.1 RNA polymerase sigma-70 factor, ECF subfamily [Marinactinospora thermotolerans DSM 45154]
MADDLPNGITTDHLDMAASMAGPLHISEGGTHQDAENAVFYAVTELWRREREEPGSIRHHRAWMWQAARRHLRRALEKARAELAVERLPEPPDHEETRPEAVHAREESTRRARELVAALPPGERAAVALRHFADLETHEIAEALRISEEAVRARLSRGHRGLKRILKEGGVRDDRRAAAGRRTGGRLHPGP